MHIRKYDFDYGRRALMEKTVKGVGAAGVLTSLWPLLAKADTPDITKAYPDELLSIEAQTKGKIKPGDVVDANNVEHVAHLLDPIALGEVKNDNRRIEIVESTKDVSRLYESRYLEATLRNMGKAVLDDKGNIWYEQPGTPWKGGTPFVEPKDGLEAMYNITLAWGRHNFSQYAIQSHDLSGEGNIEYRYNWIWNEMNVTSRVDGKIFQDRDDLVRYQSVFFTEPNEQAGVAFLSTWYRDQRKFPRLVGYLPAFKRVREYPTNQRFEPLVPGAVFYLSDAWASGDPILTWGKHKIIERKPMLGAVGPGHNWYGERENWDPPVHGGPQGKTFRDVQMELVPEVAAVQSEPIQYPRAPYGKKIVYLDTRQWMYLTSNSYDRKGQLFKSFETGSGLFEKDGHAETVNGEPVWSWKYVLNHNVQTGRMTIINHLKELNGYRSQYETDNESNAYNKFFTTSAMRRLGT